MTDFMVRWLKFSLVALVGCGFLAMLVYAFWMREDIRLAAIEPPLVAAPDMPLKRRPDEPGGLMIPHQDKVVFDLLDSPSTAMHAALDEVVDDEVMDEPVQVAVEAVSQSVQEEVIAPVVDIKPVAQIEPKPVVIAKVETPQPVSGGAWAVQVGSLSSRTDADKAVTKLRAEAALKRLTPRVVEADVKGRTTYRVQFVGLKDRSAAAAICGQLKTGCFPVAP